MKKHKPMKEIHDYDEQDVSQWLNHKKPLKLEDIGLKLPSNPPTQVISIRLPSRLLNELKAVGSARDIPYQALIKLFVSDGLSRVRKKAI